LRAEQRARSFRPAFRTNINYYYYYLSCRDVSQRDATSGIWAIDDS